jgi:hypothetical protein
MTEQVSPKPAAVLMWATYLVGVIGSAIGYYTVALDPPNLTIAALLAVFATGVLSFFRHSIFHRSDAVRGGWNYGTRNNFQIEVGLANLAWGIYALAAVVFDWGLMAVSASFLISGFYFAFVTVFVIATGDIRDRRIGPLIGIAVWAGVVISLGVLGMTAAN